MNIFDGADSNLNGPYGLSATATPIPKPLPLLVLFHPIRKIKVKSAI